MKFRGRLVLTAIGGGCLAAAGAVAQSSGPLATYWVSASTSTGMGAGMMGGGGRRAMMGILMGRGLDPNAVSRSLTLQLGSLQRPSGPPQAEHLPPATLGVGPSLPLVTPVEVKSTPTTEDDSRPAGMPERPRGRLLIYWGCGEHVGPGQPQVIDFSQIGPNMPMPRMSGSVQVRSEHPPSPGGAATYGHWPNERNSKAIPETGSLIGPHVVRGDYSPEMHFSLTPGQDFMPAFGVQNSGKTATGATRLTWSPLQQATGYHLGLFGANGGGGGSGDIVMWSSSRVQPGAMGAGLTDYLPPAEVRRLVGQGAVLPPQTGECLVPAEVATAAPMGMLMGIAFGPEADFADPPRPPRGPWAIRWAVKVRFKSTTNLMLGMPGAMGGQADDGRSAQGQSGGDPAQKKRRRPGLGDILGGFVPHP